MNMHRAILTPDAERNAMHARWIEDPRAVAILASIAANPPRQTRRYDTYVLTRDEWVKYEGRRVDQLAAIQTEYFNALDWSDADAVFAYSDCGTVQEIVAAAVDAPAMRVAA